jgi:ABC-type transport system substrate-binding protein
VWLRVDRRSVKLLALAALFGAGLCLAGAVATVGSADTTTETLPTTSTVVETTTIEQTTTAPATTVVTTSTVAPTTSAQTTALAESSSSKTPNWVWVVIALLGAAAIGLLIALLTRRGGGAMSEADRQHRLQGAIESWTAQGWALLSETADTAVLHRGNEQMTVSVDADGRINTRPLTRQPPPPDWPTSTSR